MRLIADLEACQGHNRCQVLAPELVDVDDEGYVVVKGDGEVPDELRDKAQLAVDNCPEFALSLKEN